MCNDFLKRKLFIIIITLILIFGIISIKLMLNENTRIYGLLLFLFVGFSFIFYILILFVTIKTLLEDEKTASITWNNGIKSIFNNLFTVRIHNKIDFNHPVIYCLNHPYNCGYYVFLLSFIENIKITSAIGDKNNFIYPILKRLGYINVKHGNNLDSFINRCKNELINGYNILIFPEGKNTNKKNNNNELASFQTGAFVLSKQTNVPIVPIVIKTSSEFYGFFIPSYFDIYYLPPIYPINKSIDDLKTETFNSIKNRLTL